MLATRLWLNLQSEGMILVRLCFRLSCVLGLALLSSTHRAQCLLRTMMGLEDKLDRRGGRKSLKRLLV